MKYTARHGCKSHKSACMVHAKMQYPISTTATTYMCSGRSAALISHIRMYAFQNSFMWHVLCIAIFAESALKAHMGRLRTCTKLLATKDEQVWMESLMNAVLAPLKHPQRRIFFMAIYLQKTPSLVALLSWLSGAKLFNNATKTTISTNKAAMHPT